MKIEVQRKIASGKSNNDFLGRVTCFILGSIFGVSYTTFVIAVF